MVVDRAAAVRAGHSPSEFDEAKNLGHITSVEDVIKSIPADIIARRAMECGSYARALYHWEQWMREQKQEVRDLPNDHDSLYQRLHSIYAHIDEPDGLDGISAHLNILNPEQQAFQHRRAGRWSAAQSWYEIELTKKPSDLNLQTELLSCLKESGQFDQVLHYASFCSKQAFSVPDTSRAAFVPLVAEASWSTGRLDYLAEALEGMSNEVSNDFNTGVAQVLVAMKKKDPEATSSIIKRLRSTVTRSLTTASAASLQSCHDVLLKLHAIYEMEALGGISRPPTDERELVGLLDTMNKRLAVVGSYTADKQYLLGIRRAVMSLSNIGFTKVDIASSWLTTARLARKAKVSNKANYAVLNAFRCGDDAAKIEQARLMWRDGQHRQAIQTLEGAITSGAFSSYDRRVQNPSNPEESQQKQNLLSARAHLLLAKWLDASGQTQAAKLTVKYQYAAKHHSRWDKGHYYLGKHYNKLLEAEKALPHGKQTDAFVYGEMAKVVIENYLRSVPFGSKYWYQTIPKIITLWLDLGMDCLSKARGDAQADILERRNRFLDAVHKQMRKYFDRIPPYIVSFTCIGRLVSANSDSSILQCLRWYLASVTQTRKSSKYYP